MAFERVWHKSYAPGVPTEIVPEKITMADVLKRVAQRHPKRSPSFTWGRRSLSASWSGW